MKIVIVGTGNVGSTIATQLSNAGHNITVLDTSEEAVRQIAQASDVMGMVGSGMSLPTLLDAGVAEADLVIAVTDSDEKNLLSCLMAKKAGTKNTIARVRNPEYKEEIEFMQADLGLSMSVNPELSAADEIARLLKLPNAMEIDTFANGRVELLKFEVTKDSPICGVTLKNLHNVLKTDVLMCVVERGNETMIPKGDFTIWEGDRVSFVASGKKATQFFKALNMNQGRARSVIIVGGGDTCFYLAKNLLNSGTEVKIIEKNKERCEELAEFLPDAIIINGNGTDKDLLSEEGIEYTDGFVTLTNHDEQNVVMALYAKKVNPKAKLITKLHKNVYDDIMDDLSIGSIINSKLIAAEAVVKYVRAMNNCLGSSMETLYQLNAGKAEAMEFIVKKESRLLGVELKDLDIKPDVIISCIIHKGMVETPGGHSKIREGDSVIIVTTETGIEELDQILAV